MVAEWRPLVFDREESGQSIIEFVLMMPLLLGMVILLVKINSVIQASIVDQQYARAEALFLAFNSPFYPENSKKETLIEDQMNQMLVGVSGNLASGENGDYSPQATVLSVARSDTNPLARSASDESGQEPKSSRAKVRIRNSVTLCTQNILIGFGDKGGPMPVIPLFGNSRLVEGVSYASFCQSRLKYVMDDNSGS
jgi:Flp pilus assembly protein TadG